MFLIGLSTRHTAVGTFRYGVVYKVDETDHQVRKHVLPLLEGDNPALEKITEAQAKNARAAPEQFTPGLIVPDAKAANLDLRDALAKAQLAQKEAEDRAVKAAQVAEDTRISAEALVADAEARADAATEAAADAEARATDATEKQADLDSLLKESEAIIAELKADLAKATEPDKANAKKSTAGSK